MLSAVRSYLRNEHLEGKHDFIMPSAVVLNISIIAATQTQTWPSCAFYCPSSLSLSSYLSAWSNSHTGIYTFEIPYIFLRLILIIFQRSQRPKPFRVPDLFFQPLDNSNWTMLDLRWDSLMIQGYALFFTDARIVCSERQNSQIKEKWQGLGVH